MDNCNTGIVLIDAPAGSGKTQFVRKMGAAPFNTLTSEQLIDTLLQMCQRKSSLEETAAGLSHITYIENMESLAGRPETQRLAAQLVVLMASKQRVILTGIDFLKRLPFLLETLDKQKTNYVWRTERDTVIGD